MFRKIISVTSHLALSERTLAGTLVLRLHIPCLESAGYLLNIGDLTVGLSNWWCRWIDG